MQAWKISRRFVSLKAKVNNLEIARAFSDFKKSCKLDKRTIFGHHKVSIDNICHQNNVEYEVNMQDFTTFICYRLKSTMKRVEKNIGQALDSYGVTMAQSFILFSLLEKDGCTLTEIGNRAQIDNSSLTTMVDKLEKEGLVERRLFAQDRRVVNLYLTEKGRDLAIQVYNSGADLNAELRDQLDDGEKEFYAHLDAISSILDQKKA